MNSTKYNQEFVKKLIRDKEGNHLDFKQKITPKEKIAKTLSAFANTEGGMILIGVSDKKRIIGIDLEEEKYMIESANEQFCSPLASLSFHPIKWSQVIDQEDERNEEINLLLVEVFPTENRRIFYKSKSGETKVYHRVGDRTLAI